MKISMKLPPFDSLTLAALKRNRSEKGAGLVTVSGYLRTIHRPISRIFSHWIVYYVDIGCDIYSGVRCIPRFCLLLLCMNNVRRKKC